MMWGDAWAGALGWRDAGGVETLTDCVNVWLTGGGRIKKGVLGGVAASQTNNKQLPTHRVVAPGAEPGGVAGHHAELRLGGEDLGRSDGLKREEGDGKCSL